MKILKYLGYTILLALLGLGGYICYFLLFHKDVPKTQAHVNERELNDLSLEEVAMANAWGDTMQIEQGSLVVPENRKLEETNKILVSFIRIPSRHPSPRSPIFFLAGGPGTPASQVASRSFFYVFKRLSEFADVILIDQRGTGQSIPNLRCRNEMAMPTQEFTDSEKAVLADIREKCRECAEEFREMGIDLNGYTSQQSAQDIEAIRQALQYDNISLFGYSYGTTLAQHYVAEFEQHVDRLIFAGPSAPDLGLKMPADLETQYQLMDSLVLLDQRMARYIPSFTELMASQHERLQEQPLEIKLPLMDAVGDDDGVFFTTLFKGISLFKPHWELGLNDTYLQLMMAQNLGRSSWTAIAPKYYYDLSNGEYSRLGNYLRNFRRQPMPNALFFTVAASTAYPQALWDKVTAPREDVLLPHFAISFGRFDEILEQFEVEEVPGLHAAVESEKPLLLIAGTLDGRTPLANADTIARRFPNHRRVLIQQASHNDLVDASVLRHMVQFVQGLDTGDVVLNRPFTFVPPVPYHYSIQDTLEKTRLESGVQAALRQFDGIRREFEQQDDFFYDVSEQALNNYGYQLLQAELVDDALTVFQYNVSLFPGSDNAYNSLAEGLIEKGDEASAIAALEKAIQLNYLDGYSHSLLNRFREE